MNRPFISRRQRERVQETRAMHIGSEAANLPNHLVKMQKKEERKGNPNPDLIWSTEKGYAWTCPGLVLKCQCAVVFHFSSNLFSTFILSGFVSCFYCGLDRNSSWSGVRWHLHFYYKQIRCGYKCANANTFLKTLPPKKKEEGLTLTSEC